MCFLGRFRKSSLLSRGFLFLDNSFSTVKRSFIQNSSGVRVTLPYLARTGVPYEYNRTIVPYL